MIQHEHNEAVALMRWWAYFSASRKIDHRLLYSNANQGRGGGWQAARRGAYMKEEGLRAGIPDYTLAISRGGTHGLYIELKAKKGRVSKEQSEMIELLGNQGYQCSVTFGFEEAREVIEKYLGDK
mgnify:CR=1 FL=1